MVSTTAPGCLFHVRQRRGLGCMLQGLSIAGALLALRPDARVAFHMRASPPPGFWPARMPLQVDDGTPAGSAVALARSWLPQVQVLDTWLPPCAELRELRSAAPGCGFAFVMRRCLREEQQAIYAHPALGAMDLVLVPHPAADFGHPIPDALASRCHFVGPIVRRPDPASQQALDQRLGLAPHDFVITSTAGSGGANGAAARFFDIVVDAHRRLMTTPGCEPWRHIVVLGPHFQGRLDPLPGMTVLASEPDLVGLMARSDVVVADGGYHTVSELTVVRTPAVFLPPLPGRDDQVERMRQLQERGCCRLLDTDDAAGLAHVLTLLGRDAPLRARMRERYPRAQVGNEAAARLLLALSQAAPRSDAVGCREHA
jgi:hypothetical protein